MSAALSFEMDVSSVLKWTESQYWKKTKFGLAVLGLAACHRRENGNCRYVFTPMLSGLRWPGQTIMGSWPPAESCGETLAESCGETKQQT